MFATLPPSVLREELLSLLADRLSLSPELVGSLLAQGRRLAEPSQDEGGAARAPRRLPAQELAEREFLAYCIAFPELGAPALAELDLDRDFMAASTRASRPIFATTA